LYKLNHRKLNMNLPEISAASKIIKDIKFKLNELEKIIGKAAKDKYTYPVNNQNHPPRKKKSYKNISNTVNGNK
jgi:hypothetical protein